MWTSSLLFFLLCGPPCEKLQWWRAAEPRGGGVGGGRRRQEVGAWLFLEIGLAATLHLHCGDRREGGGMGGVL